MGDQSGIEQYMPLTELEERYKALYEMFPSLDLRKPRQIKEWAELFAAIEKQICLRPSWSEYAFDDNENPFENIFPSDQDVMVFPHLRYSPAVRHSHRFFETLCVLNGCCENGLPGTKLLMKKGDVCLMAPGVMHSLCVFSDDCIVFYLLIRMSTFDTIFTKLLNFDSILSEFFSCSIYAAAGPPWLYIPAGENTNLLSSVIEMHKESLSKDVLAHELLNALVHTFFIRFIRRYESGIVIPKQSGSQGKNEISQIMNYISTNYQSVTLRELASKFNYSERQLERILTSHRKENYSEILRNIRMDKALELLWNQSIPLYRIAELVGYSSYNSFNHLFKEKYGKTPGEYRKELHAS